MFLSINLYPNYNVSTMAFFVGFVCNFGFLIVHNDEYFESRKISLLLYHNFDLLVVRQCSIH